MKRGWLLFILLNLLVFGIFYGAFLVSAKAFVMAVLVTVAALLALAVLVGASRRFWRR